MKGWWGTLLHFNKATTCPVVFPLSTETFNYFKSRCGDAWGDVREGMESIHPGLINVRWQWIQCKVMHRLHYYIKKRLQKCILMQFWQMQHFLVFSSVRPFQPDIFIWYCKMYDLKTETEPCTCLQAPLATYCTADSDVWYVSSVEDDSQGMEGYWCSLFVQVREQSQGYTLRGSRTSAVFFRKHFRVPGAQLSDTMMLLFLSWRPCYITCSATLHHVLYLDFEALVCYSLAFCGRLFLSSAFFLFCFWVWVV